MKHWISAVLAALLLLGLFACQPTLMYQKQIQPASDITLPSIFGDHMVLQQGQEIAVWGTASPSGQIIIRLGDTEVITVSDLDGNWMARLPSREMGGPFSMTIVGLDTIQFSDILIGEVWLCSGQSNMEWSVEKSNHAEKEIGNANFPNIRLLTVERNASLVPVTDVITNGWQICTPKTGAGFSAVGYFFGRELHQTLNVPVGLIHSSWGGTPAEAWTSRQSLQDFYPFSKKYAAIPDTILTIEDARVFLEKVQKADRFSESAWMDSILQKDQLSNITGLDRFDPDFDTSSWEKMQLPVKWERRYLPGYDGMVWFQKRIVLPKSMTTDSLILNLGPIDDMDVTWFNGNEVGRMDVYNRNRHYLIPRDLIQTGENVIAVRVLDTGGGGGIYGTPEQVYLSSQSGDSLSLAGAWSYLPTVDLKKLPVHLKRPKRIQKKPSVLYNGMIRPLVPFTLQGAIWYQGESNARRAYQYRRLFPALIKDWRTLWAREFPFLFVQLANFRQVKEQPSESDWAELREAQTMTLSLPNTGMATIIDIGEANNIHPRNKQDVGKRLALNALNKVYDQSLAFSGPMYHSMTIEGNSIRITFDYTGKGLIIQNSDTLKGFAIAGRDSQWVWAEARIDKNDVLVSHPDIQNPIAVRYAWADNPICNLFNKEGLPAVPFRTDDWPGVTMGAE